MQHSAQIAVPRQDKAATVREKKEICSRDVRANYLPEFLLSLVSASAIGFAMSACNCVGCCKNAHAPVGTSAPASDRPLLCRARYAGKVEEIIASSALPRAVRKHG